MLRRFGFHMARPVRSARSRLPGFLLLLLATSHPATHLQSRAYFILVAHQIFAGVRTLTSAVQYLQLFFNANMSDPPPAKKPAFSLYGDLIAPNGDSSVISSGPVKYDMKPKDPEPEAQKKKNGRVAFYIFSS